MMFDIEKARKKGMNEKTIAILQRINENELRREGCAHHDFERIDALKFRCSNCGYECNAEYVHGYTDGIKHTGKKQGQWWVPFHSAAGGDIQYCSACEIGCDEKTDYCPHCGAKMDGKGL